MQDPATNTKAFHRTYNLRRIKHPRLNDVIYVHYCVKLSRCLRAHASSMLYYSFDYDVYWLKIIKINKSISDVRN